MRLRLSTISALYGLEGCPPGFAAPGYLPP